jgi:hypothetical protein
MTNIEILRDIVKRTEQAGQQMLFKDVQWMVTHARDVVHEINAMKAAELPIESFEAIAKNLTAHMDAILEKAKSVAMMKRLIGDLEAENASLRQQLTVAQVGSD